MLKDETIRSLWPFDVDIRDKARVAAELGKRIRAVRGGLSQQAHDRQLRHVVGFAEMERQRGVAAQVLGRSHQGHILGERNAIVLIFQELRIDAGALGERSAVRSFRHRKVRQGLRKAGCDRRFSHRDLPV